MILRDVEREVIKADANGFVLPRYDGFSLYNVPHTATNILGGKPAGRILDASIGNRLDTHGIKKVAILLVDGFGYDMFVKSMGYASFFRKISEKGIIAPITSGFPSTTAASITTMNTGLTPPEHGLLEWVLYFKEIGKTINTLPFTSMDNVPLRGKHSPEILYSGKTLYEHLNKEGINAYSIIDRQLDKSEYNNLFSKAKKGITHVKNSDLAIRLRDALEGEKGKGYFYAYISSVDTSTHAHGPHTEESEAEILSVSHSIEDGLLAKLKQETAEETLLMITADHGHTLLDPKKTIYLNRYRSLDALYARDSNGTAIPPVGSPRDVFLHIRAGKLQEAADFLSKKLEDTAEVLKIDEAIEKGIFGDQTSKAFSERAGNLIILPFGGKSVWYEHVHGKKHEMIGMHGGLSKEEMLIPLAAVRLSELI